MAQTPQQRKANERYARAESAKRGQPEAFGKTKQVAKSPIKTGWLVVLGFVVFGGIVFELLRLFVL